MGILPRDRQQKSGTSIMKHTSSQAKASQAKSLILVQVFLVFFFSLPAIAEDTISVSEAVGSVNGETDRTTGKTRQTDHQRRPIIGVVLEGGGAKGFAHVGVLKVLEENNVPVDIIVGTSMGSIVGAAYASGRTIPEMEHKLSTTDWDGLFNETPPRQVVHYRQKSGRERELYGDAKVGIKDFEFIVPSAFIQGQNVEPVLQELYGKVPSSVNFDDLPVRYRAVAADLETGEAVILDHGSLATAARASMSVPGFFSPVELNGRVLVDGGITDNLPIDVALDLGAEVIIAVECKDFLKTRDQLKGPLAVPGQIIDLLLERTTQNSLKLLRPQDVHIQVKLGEYSSSSFNKASEIMKHGEDEARNHIADFSKLAVSDAEYEKYLQKRTSKEEYRPVISYVHVEGIVGYHVAEIKRALKNQINKPLNREEIMEDLTPIVQSGDFTKVTYDIEEKDGETGLIVKATPKSWLKNYTRLGFALDDDFDGNSNYSLAVEGRFNGLNEAGAYADVQLEAGRSPRAFVELYQPLYQGSSFFVAPEASVVKQDLPIRDSDSIVAEFQRQENTLALKGGYSLGKYGEFLTGWKWGQGWIERRIGEAAVPDLDYDVGEVFAKLSLDQFDNPDFPTKGYRFSLLGTASDEDLGASDDFEKGQALAALPFTFGSTTILLNAEAGIAPDDLPAERYSTFGGFFDISGFEQASLIASDYWIYRTAAYYRIAQGGSALFPFGGYIGGTIELASLRSNLEDIDDREGLVAGSIFIGADTPLLPIYLGFGMSDESEKSVYLNIGRLNGRRR